MARIKLRTKISGVVSIHDLEDREIIFDNTSKNICVRDYSSILHRFCPTDDSTISANTLWSSTKVNAELSTVSTSTNVIKRLIRRVYGLSNGIISDMASGDFYVFQPNNPANMYIRVAPGVAFINDDIFESTTNTNLLVSPTISGIRFDLVQINNNTKLIEIKTGIPNSGLKPTASTNCLGLAYITVEPNNLQITQQKIEDKRFFL